MSLHDHHAAVLWITGVVFIVVMTGAYMVLGPSGSPTGHVVLDPVADHPCGSCSGSPVCAVKGEKVYNYENACAAACDGARILSANVCERI